jgi:hypothetical protein
MPGGRASTDDGFAWLVGLIAVPTAAYTTFSAFLRAYQRPDRELSAHLCAAAVTCIGIVGIGAWGLLGAIMGLLASAVTTMLVMFWWVLRTGIVPSSSHAETPGFAEVNDDIGLVLRVASAIDKIDQRSTK